MNEKLSPLDDVMRALCETARRPMEKAISLPPTLYWRDDVAALETDRIFRREWVCAGLAAELSEVGDYLSFSIAGEPIFCIRDAAGAIRSFSNVCRHRMMCLVDGYGRAKRIVCPYHAWTYDLGGRLIGGFCRKFILRSGPGLALDTVIQRGSRIAGRATAPFDRTASF